MKAASRKRFMGFWAVMVGLLLGWYGASGFDASMAWAKESMDDPNWKGYTRVSGVSGNINSIGSDTLNNLMTLWAEGFRKQYPNVKIQIEGKGSSTAPPTSGTGVPCGTRKNCKRFLASTNTTSWYSSEPMTVVFEGNARASWTCTVATRSPLVDRNSGITSHIK